MECPECGSEAKVASKREYRHDQGEPITEIRTYACMNLECAHGFVYRNSYLKETERFDVKRFIRQYEKRYNNNQEELFTEES